MASKQRVHASRRSPIATIAALLCLLAPASALAQLDFERPPIDYHETAANDPVAQLARRLEAGELELTYHPERGYLPALLELLAVPTSTQALVFSKTSFQLRKISPYRPRALYFSDDMYVGFVPFGDVIELTGVDPELGAIYYTLDQKEAEHPKFVRDRGQCLVCHASSRTQGVPGHLVRSVFADADGQPLLGSGTYTTDHRSPFDERWGGWYVTGEHGDMRHMGNLIAEDPDHPEQLDREAGANRTSLEGLVDTGPYLEPTSDIVALMVLEHQGQMHNFITLANFETRAALHHNQIMNEALERPADHISDSTRRRVDAVAEKLVQYLFFVDEFELTSPVKGTSSFAADFAATGPQDSRGRSLRDLDLTRRLFQYPCSYLIYSPSLLGLPDLVKQRVFQRVAAVLGDHADEPGFTHLSAADRTAIREILVETHPELRSVLQG